MAFRRSLVVPVVVGSLFAVASVDLACSSSDHPPPAGSSSSGNVPFDASTDVFVLPESGVEGASKTPLGDLPTTDEPDVPCVSATAAKTILFPKSAFPTTGGPPARLVQTLGARRFAAGPNMTGFATFDDVGTTPQFFASTFGNAAVSYTSEGTTIGGFAADTTSLTYQRYDAQGVASGSPVTIASTAGVSGTWVGAGGGGSLVVWPEGGDLKAAGVTAGGAAAGAPWTLAAGASSPRVAVTYANNKYVIAYSYTSGTSSFAKVQFADATGASGAPVNITSSATSTIIVTAITPTSSGFLLAFDGGGDDMVYLVPLDAAGAVNGTARRLLGGDEPYALASRGTEVGLVTMSNDVKVGNMEGPRKPLFRAVDAVGKPLAPWVCLDNVIGATQTQDMGVLADGAGYSIVMKTVGDDTALTRVDRLGTGAL
jgi:hypothetical protein